MTTCYIPGCKKPIHSNGVCNTHYSKFWRAKVELPTIIAPMSTLKILLADARICLKRACISEEKLIWHKRVRDLKRQLCAIKDVVNREKEAAHG